MALQQKKVFLGGINSDTADELMPDGQDRYRLNVRALSSDNNQTGAIETVLGNTLVVNTVPLPTGVNTVIGGKEDLIRRKVYYFVHNSNNDHSIFEYDIVSGVISLVLQDSGLNFNKAYLINSINFVELDADNTLMYWTDGYNEPRKINIQKGKYYSVGNFTLGYKSPFDIKWIARIKQPPPIPTTNWSTDPTVIVNRLLNKNYQFKVQYVYDDNEFSAFSPISRFTFPIVTYAANNNAGQDYTQENTIRVFFNSGDSIVKRVRIAAKETNENDYYLVADLDKEESGYLDNTLYNFRFTNDGVYIPIEVNESIKLYDNVPQVCETHDIIAGNRIADGNITEGYDPIEISMLFSMGFKAVNNNTPNPKQITNESYLKSGGEYTFGVVYYDEFNRSGTTNTTYGYTTNLPNSSGNVGTTLKVPFLTETAYTLKQLNSAPDVRWDIYNEAPSWAKKYQIVRSKNRAIRRYVQFAAQAIYYYDANGTIIDPVFSTPAQCNVEIFNITDRYKTEYPSSRLVYDYVQGDRIRMIANPPYSAIGYTPLTTYAPTAITAAPNVVNLPYNDYEFRFDATTQTISFKINATAPFSSYNDVYLPGCIFEIYTPENVVDDDNQIMYEIGEVQNVVFSNGRYLHNGSGGNQIIVNSTGGTFAAFILTLSVPTGHGLLNGHRVKVIEGQNYGYGTVVATSANSVDINTSGVWTGGATVTACTIYKSAFGTLTSGDSFRPYQDMPFVIDGSVGSGYAPPQIPPYTGRTVYRWYSHVENMNVNNFFASKQYDYGRPNKVDKNYKRIKRPTTIYYSESFIPETNINGLSSVFDTSFETYEERYGGIYKLYAENQTLLMLQELKIAQIPVKQVIYNDLQGGTTVGASPTILNSQAMYYAGEYGIGKHPHSFAVFGNAKYGIDVLRGTLWRLSIDGLTPLSDTYFMRNFMTDVCQALIKNSAENLPILGVYDKKFDEYIITFPGYTSVGGDRIDGFTLAFNEKANAFSTFYSFLPEYYATNGLNILSFKSGNLYTHNTNNTYCNFYGQQFKSEIWAVLNIEPSKVKVFEAISQETNDAWEVHSIVSPNNQITNLIESDFVEKENNQYAPLWKDVNTPNLPSGTQLFNGDDMRDRTFLVRLRYNPTTYNKLYALNFYVIASERSNK